MVDTVKIKISLEAPIAKTGRGESTTYIVQLGRFEGQAHRKIDAVAEIEQAIERAVKSGDLGAVVRVGIAGDRIYVLHSQYDGRYEICSAPLAPAGEGLMTDQHGPELETRDNAVSVFEDRLERAQQEATNRPGPADAGEALRRLASRVGIEVAEGEIWRDVAQRVAFAVHALEHRAGASITAVVSELSPEALALARVLGLPGSRNGSPNPLAIRQEADAILSEYHRGLTLSNARDSHDGWLATLDALVEDHKDSGNLQEMMDDGDLVHVDKIEEYIADKDGDWEIDGPIDKRIAELIGVVRDAYPKHEDQGLYGKALEALNQLLELAVDRARADSAETSRESIAAGLDNFDLPEKRERRWQCRLLAAKRRSRYRSTRGFPLAHLPGCQEVALNENGDVAWRCAPECLAVAVDDRDRLAHVLGSIVDDIEHREGAPRPALVEQAREALERTDR